MDTNTPLPLLGGLTPAQFMRRHWQKKPLLVRQAIPGFCAPLGRSQLFALAVEEGVESRAVIRHGRDWSLKRGPFGKRDLPPVKQPAWTLLVQGVDLHDDRVRSLLDRFRFVPEARLDDLMVSWASDGGGVGPHFDSYDVFLLQGFGKRRWRIGRQKDFSLQPGVPLKILSNFTPEEEHVLEPGDMLYLPPRWAHDGIAEGECQTWSIGFRSPWRGELARELLQRLADGAEDLPADAMYVDPKQDAVDAPGAIPAQLQAFAQKAVADALKDRDALPRALGEYLTEPKANVWFEPGAGPRRLGALALDRRSRMMYDARHVFLNGESWRAGGADARLMRKLADARRLDARDVAGASEDARSLLRNWCEAGWLHPEVAK